MEYLFEDYCDEENSLDLSDGNESDEDKIDSDLENALYSQIHHTENPSFETFQKHSSEEANSNLQNDVLLNTESRNTCEIVNGDDKNFVTISSSVSNSSDSVEFLCEVEKKGSIEPEVVIFSNDNNTSIDSREKNKKWWEKFVSVTYSDDDENINTLKKCLQEKKSQSSVSSSNTTNSNRSKFTLNIGKNSSLPATNQHADSDSSEDIFKNPSKSTDNIFLNLDTSSSREEEGHNGDLWYVNNDDLYPQMAARYYNRDTNSFCNNCLRRGHKTKQCEQPKRHSFCYLCGDGTHYGRSCPNSSCQICLSSDHKTKRCKLTGNIEFLGKCDICKYEGHLEQFCPDTWRRYHLTTNITDIKQGTGNANTRVYCYNCGKKGHFGHKCNRPRMEEENFPMNPFIASYNIPSQASCSNTKMSSNKKTDKLRRLLAKKKKKKKKKQKLKNVSSSGNIACIQFSGLRRETEPSAEKPVHSVTDYVNLLHVPKEKIKKRKTRKQKVKLKQPANNKTGNLHRSILHRLAPATNSMQSAKHIFFGE